MGRREGRRLDGRTVTWLQRAANTNEPPPGAPELPPGWRWVTQAQLDQLARAWRVHLAVAAVAGVAGFLAARVLMLAVGA